VCPVDCGGRIVWVGRGLPRETAALGGREDADPGGPLQQTRVRGEVVIARGAGRVVDGVREVEGEVTGDHGQLTYRRPLARC
jgi:hypothetical protein